MKIILYGGTGQCKVMRPIADAIGNVVAVLDDTPDLAPPFDDVPLYCGNNCLKNWTHDACRSLNAYGFAVTIGNPHAKERISISRRLMKIGLYPVNLIHESAIIDSTVKIGIGVQIHAGVIINPHTVVGDFCILNTNCSIDHDCVLESGVEVAPGATLCGEIFVEENAWICAGATILPRINIGSNATIGAGAVVIKNVVDNETVAGVPARHLR